MTLESIEGVELQRRVDYITKIKNDNYHWCFPPELNATHTIHDTIDFLHKKVKHTPERDRERIPPTDT
jgi:hypothetical protein